MKKPNYFSLCLLFLTGMFISSCVRDCQPLIPAEKEHHHHVAETKWDEEFWQKLQTDTVFIQLREVSSYDYLLRDIDEGMDEDSFRKAFRDALNKRTMEVGRLSDSLLALYPEKYDTKYFIEALNNNDAQTRSSHWINEVVVVGQRSYFRVVSEFFLILDDINYRGFSACPGLRWTWQAGLGPTTSSTHIWYLWDFVMEYTLLHQSYNVIHDPTFGYFYEAAARDDVFRASDCINGTQNYYPNRIPLGGIIQLTNDLSNLQLLTRHSTNCYHDFAGCNCPRQGISNLGSGGGGGGYYPPQNPPTYSETVNSLANKLISALGDKIKNIKTKLTVKTEKLDGSLASLTSPDGTDDFVFDKTKPITLTITTDLSDVQMKLTMAHEFRHLVLDEICREAGSLNNLKNINPDLYGDMLFFRNDEGQHKYMGKTVDQTEQMLRDAFPGESEEFYKYGKWAGGAWETPEFNHLVSDEEKRVILLWLYDKNL